MEFKNWILTHKALTALVLVLLTLVPWVPEYELVDEKGNDREYYKTKLCSQAEIQEACDGAVEMEFGFQMALSLAGQRKQPLIPGLFYRKKSFGFRFDDAAVARIARAYKGFSAEYQRFQKSLK